MNMGKDRSSHRLRYILWTLSMCLILTRSNGNDICPTNCVCKGVSAVCSNLQHVPDDFPKNVMNITITQSTFMTLGPLMLGERASHIVIRDTEITSIGEHFLRDSFAPLTLEFSTVVINTISSGAFSNIHNLISLSFHAAQIDTIEKDAFKEFSAVGKISFNYANIMIIKAEAFRNISVSKFILTDCEIEEIETASFHSIHISDIFMLNGVIFRRMKKEAFKMFKEIRKVHIEKCWFLSMECNSIMGLREATSKHSDSFYFSNSTLQCDCGGVAFFKYVQRHPNSVSRTVLCIATNNDSHLSGPVLKVKDNYHKGCLREMPNVCKLDSHQDTVSTQAALEADFKTEGLTSTRQEGAEETTAVAMNQPTRRKDMVTSESEVPDEVVEASDATDLDILETKNIAVTSKAEILLLFISLCVYFTKDYIET